MREASTEAGALFLEQLQGDAMREASTEAGALFLEQVPGDTMREASTEARPSVSSMWSGSILRGIRRKILGDFQQQP